MIAWLGKILAGDLIQQEIQKLKAEVIEIAKKAVVDSIAQSSGTSGFKGELYKYIDGIAQQAQAVGKDKWDAWWEAKRAELKQYLGQ